MVFVEILESTRPGLHLILHVAVPLAIAFAFGGDDKWRVFWWMLAAMVIDVDHLIADPIYAPGRCSIGFHPLHQWPAAMVYTLLSIAKPTRWFGLGCLLHLALDALDCLMMNAV